MAGDYSEWRLTAPSEIESSGAHDALRANGPVFRTSAKNGQGVEKMFLAIATVLVAPTQGPR